MTSALHSISDRVIEAIVELFEYYIFLLHSLFARDLDSSVFEVRFTSLRLFNAINSITTRLIEVETDAVSTVETNGTAEGQKSSDTTQSRYARLSSSTFVNLQSTETLFALAERLVGVESASVDIKQLAIFTSTIAAPSSPSNLSC